MDFMDPVSAVPKRQLNLITHALTPSISYQSIWIIFLTAIKIIYLVVLDE